MSFDPFDYEAEERKDSERFADASVFDGPDPSEYMEMEVEIVSYSMAGDYARLYEKTLAEYRKPSMIDENTALKGLLALLFAVLAGLMVWILVGAAVMRWILR